MRRSYDTETLEDQLFGSRDPEEYGIEPDMEEVELPGEGGPVTVNATLEDGTQAEYLVAGVFLEGEKEYIALETGDGDIHIMELEEGEEGGVRLLSIEDEEEQERAIEAFQYYFEQEDTENPIESENEDDRDQDREED